MHKKCGFSILPVRCLAGTLLLPISFTCALLLPMLGLSGCWHKARIPADQPVIVALRAPKQILQPDSVALSGTIEANTSAMAAFQIAGKVSRVLVDEGQSVRQGQILATLDATDYRNGYDAASAQADAARAQDAKARAGARSQELEQARLDYDSWQDKYTRMKYLYEHKSLAEQDFKQIEDGYLAARQRYEMAREGARVEDRTAATAQRRAAEAQMHHASKQLADCELRAPIAGQIGMRRIDVGDSVGSGTPVISVLNLDPVNLRVSIPESQIGKIAIGNRAVVTIPALGGRSFEGTVETLGVAADPASRSFSAKITLANHDHLLRAGMVAEARIYSKTQINMLTIPGEAIERDPRGFLYVYVFDPARKRAYQRRVETGAMAGAEVEIHTGLAATDQVVTAGQQSLHEGAAVVSPEVR